MAMGDCPSCPVNRHTSVPMTDHQANIYQGKQDPQRAIDERPIDQQVDTASITIYFVMDLETELPLQAP
jgi:hypothetical protein